MLSRPPSLRSPQATSATFIIAPVSDLTAIPFSVTSADMSSAGVTSNDGLYTAPFSRSRSGVICTIASSAPAPTTLPRARQASIGGRCSIGILSDSVSWIHDYKHRLLTPSHLPHSGPMSTQGHKPQTVRDGVQREPQHYTCQSSKTLKLLFYLLVQPNVNLTLFAVSPFFATRSAPTTIPDSLSESETRSLNEPYQRHGWHNAGIETLP